MNDTINVTPARSNSITLASPKIAKQKPNPTPGVIASVAFGCEHIQAFNRAGEKSWKTFTQQYNSVLKSIRDEPRVKTATVKLGKDRTDITLRSTFLCLQCPHIFPQEGTKAHFEGPKVHSFCHTLVVESRSGHIFCHNCSDYIYDPTLDLLRSRLFSPPPSITTSNKRTHTEYASEPAGLVAANSNFVPCRAIGLRGLYNMGNTCFMSVVIQSLLHNPFIKTWYLSEGHKGGECEREHCTSCAFEEIFCEFWSVEKTEGYGAVPMLLSSWKSAEHLAGYQQQDAHEYMQFMLNSLHTTNLPSSGDSPNPSTTSSSNTGEDCTCIIHSTFGGKLASTVTCSDCKNKTVTIEEFLDLSLDLRNAVAKKRKLNGSLKEKDKNDKGEKNGDAPDEGMKLDECLRRFTAEESLAKEGYTCRKCGGARDAVKQLSLKRLPPVLSIHLKRFSASSKNGSTSSKLETSVHFPISLNMSPYTCAAQSSKPTKSSSTTSSTPSDPPSSSPQEARYTLSAVIVHKGEMNSGHYVSYAREGRDWFLFDDSKVVLVGEGEVLKAQAYLLVYVVEKF
ncbi:cysteine proteinase [Tothia fuscella]|uniref:Ubiquitin carboxyl-terminal hydrolase n=1 Tax=Tothia fuscella TaxID=1048955 RepID=A0A9P4NMH1_9PEZI|nr:cysteine proteinase [Tothia fuscella]